MTVAVRLYVGERCLLKVGFADLDSAKRWLREHRRSFKHDTLHIECNSTN